MEMLNSAIAGGLWFLQMMPTELGKISSQLSIEIHLIT